MDSQRLRRILIASISIVAVILLVSIVFLSYSLYQSKDNIAIVDLGKGIENGQGIPFNPPSSDSGEGANPEIDIPNDEVVEEINQPIINNVNLTNVVLEQVTNTPSGEGANPETTDNLDNSGNSQLSFSYGNADADAGVGANP